MHYGKGTSEYGFPFSLICQSVVSTGTFLAFAYSSVDFVDASRASPIIPIAPLILQRDAALQSPSPARGKRRGSMAGSWKAREREKCIGTSSASVKKRAPAFFRRPGFIPSRYSAPGLRLLPARAERSMAPEMQKSLSATM